MAKRSSIVRRLRGERAASEAPADDQPAAEDPPTASGRPAERTAAPPEVTLTDVRKSYGSGAAAVEALRGVDLEIRRGEFAVLLGPSGSGKTTLLDLIGGIERPTSGKIVVDGIELGTQDAGELTMFRRDHVGFVFQFFNLVPALTAFENVELVAELVGAGASESNDALTAVGLGDRRDHFPGALSGGEQQRVAIARAIVKKPPVLLCDEPTGSLDLATGRQVLAVLRELNTQRQITVVLVTHNQAISTMADVVIHLSSGQIAQVVVNSAPTAANEVVW
jgi:putative ABC transport system ATP-binding protein